MSSISFHSEIASFKLKDKIRIKKWLKAVVGQHKGKISAVQFIFCDDEYLLNINQQYLDHDTFTDIITFRYQEHPNPLESDIYISVERVKENSGQFGADFGQELRRVMVHGILHLLGFKDKSSSEKQIMRQEEDNSLQYYLNIH